MQVLKEPEQINKEISFAEMYRMAQKELTQIKNSYGKRSKKTACLMGVLGFYSGNDMDNFMDETIDNKYLLFSTEINKIFYRPLAILNDVADWTFEDAAQVASQLGY